MQLGFGIRFNDLYEREGLAARRRRVPRFSGESDAALARAPGRGPRRLRRAGKEESDLLVALAPHVEDFIAQLFGIEAEAQALAEQHNELAPLYSVKRLFVQRRAMHKVKPEDAQPDGFQFTTELDFARKVTEWLKDEAAHAAQLEAAARYAAWAATTPEGKAKHRHGVLFKAPRKLDFMRLVPVHTDQRQRLRRASPGAPAPARGLRAHRPRHRPRRRARRGELLHLVPRAGQGLVLEGSEGEGARRQNSKRRCSACRSHGCPLEEKISEFHMVKARGQPLAALGIIAVDNPMVAATGHRICNDCMKSCIYQKQDPVNIPQAETRTLKDVLELPWGFEIYSLLTRWNPLNLRRPYPKRPPARASSSSASGRRASRWRTT